MKIVADENVDRQIVDRLRGEGHQVSYIAEFDPGADDEIVLLLSRESDAILLTADKDFGEILIPQTDEPCRRAVDPIGRIYPRSKSPCGSRSLRFAREGIVRTVCSVI